MIRVLALVAVLATLGLASATSLSEAPAAAQIQTPNTTITVSTVVIGDAPTGSTIEMVCDDPLPIPNGHVLLNFDERGAPTTTNGAFQIDDGAWVLSGAVQFGEPCEFKEVETGNALSVNWTCDYAPLVEREPSPYRQGCYAGSLFANAVTVASSGSDAGPVSVSFSGSEVRQSLRLVFTNRFPDAVVEPSFTG